MAGDLKSVPATFPEKLPVFALKLNGYVDNKRLNKDMARTIPYGPTQCHQKKI